MKFLYNSQKTIKAGFYLDYYTKKCFSYIFKKIFQNNFIYLIDKFIAENFFFFFKNFFSFFTLINELIKKATPLHLFKIIIFLSLQIIIIILL